MAAEALGRFSTEKRRGQRNLVEAILRSAIIRPIGKDTEIWGMTVNQSIYGVQVSVPIELAPKTEVEVTLTQRVENNALENRQYMGRICWCSPDRLLAEAYNVGIEFHDPSSSAR